MKRDKLGHARELSHRSSEKHTNRSRQSAKDLLVMVVLIPTLFKMSGCEATLNVSEQTVTWDEARKKCRTDANEGCLSTGSVDKWLRDGKTPEGLQANEAVWVEARFLHKLVWAAGSNDESDVFTKRGCFKRNMTDAGQPFTDVHGPYVCYDKCYSSTTRNFRIYTKDGDCYCVAKSSYNGTEVDPSYCHTIYEGTLDYSGNADKYYSVYEIPQDLIIGTGFLQLPCFTARFRASNGKMEMHISSTSCDLDLNAICIGSDQQQLQNVSGTFSQVKRLCAVQNQQLLYLNPQPGGDSGLQTLLEKVKALVQNELNNFYVDITRNSSAFWVDGRQFSYDISSQQFECIAVVTDSDKVLRFDTRPCNQSYKFVCSCLERTPQTDGGARANKKQQQSPTQKEIVIAIAAGVTGVVFLAIFIIVVVVLYCMKRSGKLRGRKSSISHSTSRSGEWDQGEASRTWDRSSRSTSIDYIDSKITPLVAGKGALPAIYENSKSDGSGALTAGNGNKDAQHLYDVCGLLDEEKSRTLPLKHNADGAENGDDYSEPVALAVEGAGYAEPETESRKQKTSMRNQKPDTGNGDYVNMGGNHYTEVSIEEEQGIIVTARLATGARDYDTPRAQRRNHSSEIDGTGDQKNTTKKKPTSAASAAACGSVDATNHPIGDFSSDRHVGPMGDVYTEVRKEAGIGVIKIVGSPKPDPQASHYKVPKCTLLALPANGDKTEAKEIRGKGGNVGIRGPLGDIYAEVK